MFKRISEFIPEAVRKMTGQELAERSVSEIFPPKSPSIYGDWNGKINSFEQAQNILDIADISREVGAKLSPGDQETEKQAFNLLRKYKKGKAH